MVIKFLDLHKQYLRMKNEIDSAISRVIATSSFVGGEEVLAFEREFSEFLGEGVKSLGVANGSDALEIAIEALNLPKNSEVLVPANTFIASAEAVIRNSLKVVFVDCGENYLMDFSDLKSKITPQTRAIVAVHLYGNALDMPTLMEIAKEYNLRVVEDCAQSHGAEFLGRKVGTFGDVATFSFYPGKNLGAYGDGGMIVSRDSRLLERCRKIAHHGGLVKYQHEIIGRNSRLDGIQAAILRVKLGYLESWNTRRREIAKMYYEGLATTSLVLPKVDSRVSCVWHLFVVRTSKRDRLKAFLESKGVQCGLHYPKALPNTLAFKDKEYVKESPTPNADVWQEEILSLPMGEHLEDGEVKRVILAVKCV